MLSRSTEGELVAGHCRSADKLPYSQPARKRECGGGKPKRDFAGARPCVEHVVEIREMWLARHMPTIDEQTKMFGEVTDKGKACS